MCPNFANMQKVLDRIDEIARRCRPPMEKPNQSQPVPQSVQNRFVELLEKKEEPRKDDKEEHKEKTRGIPGLLPGKTKAGASASMDDLRRSISRSADKYNIDEELIRAVIQVESGWKADAVSVKGAMGLMQLMPRTASMLGVEDAFDPGQNIEGGVKYLAQLTDKYKGDVEKALAAYNAGPSRVDAAGGAPFPETARYVRNVMALYHRYREED